MEPQYHDDADNVQPGYTTDHVMNVSGNYLGTYAAFIATPPNGGSFDVDVEHPKQEVSEATRIEQLHSVGIMIRPAPFQNTPMDASTSTSQQRMHTDERKTMSTRIIIDDEVTSTPTSQ